MPRNALRDDWLDTLKLLTGQQMLWDVVVEGTSLREWDDALSAIREAAGREHDISLVEDIDVPLDLVFRDQATNRRIVVKLLDAEAHCHFSSPDEIEFDVDPRTLTRQEGPALLALMKILASSTGRHCLLTPENFHHRPLLHVDPASGTIVLHDEERAARHDDQKP